MPRRKSQPSALDSDMFKEAQRTWQDPADKAIKLGWQALKQAELVAVLIGTGVRGRSALSIGNAVLDKYLSLYDIHLSGTIEGLMEIPGIGRHKAMRIMAAIEMGRKLYRWRQLQQPRKPSERASDDLIGNLTPPAPEPEPPLPGPSDAELIAAIIGSGIRGRSARVIAEDLLSRFGGSFRGLYDQDMGDFLSVKGLNSEKIIRICAALEIAMRVLKGIAW